jgi:hypothetical protein
MLQCSANCEGGLGARRNMPQWNFGIRWIKGKQGGIFKSWRNSQLSKLVHPMRPMAPGVKPVVLLNMRSSASQLNGKKNTETMPNPDPRAAETMLTLTRGIPNVPCIPIRPRNGTGQGTWKPGESQRLRRNEAIAAPVRFNRVTSADRGADAGTRA